MSFTKSWRDLMGRIESKSTGFTENHAMTAEGKLGPLRLMLYEYPSVRSNIVNTARWKLFDSNGQ